MLIAKGGIPYLDGFDNKGPVLYILNCIGYLISKKYGVFFVEFIFMLLYLCVQYAISRRFADVKGSVIYTIAASGPMGAFFVGNMTEEYALFFISISILIFVDYFLFDKKDWYRIVICGISCGAVLMIRPNMIAVWAVFCIYAICLNIRKNKSFPVRVFLLFMAGVLLVVIPILIWLGVNGAVEEFWKDYIVYNIGYSNEYNSLSNIYKSVISYIFPSLSEIYFALLLILIIKNEKRGFNVTYAIFMIANVLLISLSGKGFDHYGMIVLPTLIYPLSASSIIIKKFLKKKSFYFDLFSVFSSILLFCFILNNLLTTIPALMSDNPFDSRNEKIVSVINTLDPEDRILVLGYKDYFYVESDRLASSKYHYFISINGNYAGDLESVTEDINENLPELVVIDEGYDYGCLNFNFDNYYLLDEELNIWKLNE